MSSVYFYLIGIFGQLWGDVECVVWCVCQQCQCSYYDDVVVVLEWFGDCIEIVQYGQFDFLLDYYLLFVVISSDWDFVLLLVLIIGGVYGYEISGVYGVLLFLEQKVVDYVGCINLLVVFCVSLWGYECIQCWNFDVLDINWVFCFSEIVEEVGVLMCWIVVCGDMLLVYVDLYEIIDSDVNEFDLVLVVCDGRLLVLEIIFDGFYVIGNSENFELVFQWVLIVVVEKIIYIV